MAFSLTSFAAVRPYLYHLTSASHLSTLRQHRRIFSAATLMKQAKDTTFIRQKRSQHVQINWNGIDILVRDQAPLYAGRMTLDKGWTFEDFLEHLNRRVFFWPGTQKGPNSYGERHFQRYESEAPIILRVQAQGLFDEQGKREPLFCRYNSGAPRCIPPKGLGSPRGTDTFVRAADADFRPREVVEVTLEDYAVLPSTTEWVALGSDKWKKL